MYIHSSTHWSFVLERCKNGKTKEAIPIIALSSQPTERSEENRTEILSYISAYSGNKVTSHEQVFFFAIADCSTGNGGNPKPVWWQVASTSFRFTTLQHSLARTYLVLFSMFTFFCILCSIDNCYIYTHKLYKPHKSSSAESSCSTFSSFSIKPFASKRYSFSFSRDWILDSFSLSLQIPNAIF